MSRISGNPTTIDVRAAGAVLWRHPEDAAHEVEVALVHRPRYDDWSFPKGKLDAGESMPAAAVREVAEETGQRVRLGPALADVYYEVPDGHKIVRYWSAESRGGTFVANGETDELRWVSPDRAATLLSYQRDVDVLHRFGSIGVPTSTVLLVRHAKAGSRHQWKGDDDLRPLSGSGREQAQQLAALLPLYGPDRILSAPPLRCRETVAPLGDHLGMAVGDEPLFGEEGYWADPAAARARLHALAGEPGITVLCSQGGVIPDLVAVLAEESPHPLDVDPDDIPARKASTWVLGFDGSVLRSADHHPDPAG
jgi:8-oxo-(d)GTP phosphatase